MKKQQVSKLLFIFPIMLTIFSYFPLSQAVRIAKFDEKWIDIKRGVDAVTSSSLFIDKFYTADGKHDVNLLAHMLHLYETDGLYICQYNENFHIQTDPELNNFTTFNPMAYSDFQEVFREQDHGEVVVRYKPLDPELKEPARDVYTYFKWLPGDWQSEKYLLIIASSIYALKTQYSPFVVIVYLVSLAVIVASIIMVVLINNHFEIKAVKNLANRGNEVRSIEDIEKEEEKDIFIKAYQNGIPIITEKSGKKKIKKLKGNSSKEVKEEKEIKEVKDESSN